MTDENEAVRLVVVCSSDSSSGVDADGVAAADPPVLLPVLPPLVLPPPNEFDSAIAGRRLPVTGEDVEMARIHFGNSRCKVRITYALNYKFDATLHGWSSELTDNKGKAFQHGHVVKKRCLGVWLCTSAGCPGRQRVLQRTKADATMNCRSCQSACVRVTCDVRFVYTFISQRTYCFEQTDEHKHPAAPAAQMTVVERDSFHRAFTAAPRGLSGVQVSRPLVADAPFASRLNSAAAVRRLQTQERQLALPLAVADEAQLAASTPFLLAHTQSPWMMFFGFLPVLTFVREQLMKGKFVACCADSTRNMFRFDAREQRNTATVIHVTGIVLEHNSRTWPLALALTTSINTESYERIFREFLRNDRALAIAMPSSDNLPLLGVTTDFADALAHGVALALCGVTCSNSTVDERARCTRIVADQGRLRFCKVHWLRAAVKFSVSLSGPLQKDLEAAMHHLYAAVRAHGVMSERVASLIEEAIKCRAVRGVTIEEARAYFAWYTANGGMRLSVVCGVAPGADRLPPTTNWVEGWWGAMKQYHGFRDLVLCGDTLKKLVDFISAKSGEFTRMRMGAGAMPVAAAPNLLPTRDRRRRRSGDGANARAARAAAIAASTPVTPDVPINRGVARTLTQHEVDRQRALFGVSAMARRAQQHAIAIERITQAPPYVRSDLHASVTVPASQDAPIGTPLQLGRVSLQPKGFSWPQDAAFAHGLYGDLLVLFVAAKSLTVGVGDGGCCVIEPVRVLVDEIDNYLLQHVRGDTDVAQRVIAAAGTALLTGMAAAADVQVDNAVDMRNCLFSRALVADAACVAVFAHVLFVDSPAADVLSAAQRRLAPQRRSPSNREPQRRLRRRVNDSDDEFAPPIGVAVTSGASSGVGGDSDVGGDDSSGESLSSERFAVNNSELARQSHVLARAVMERFGSAASSRPLVIVASLQHEVGMPPAVQFAAAWRLMSQLPLTIQFDAHAQYELIGVQCSAVTHVWVSAEVAGAIRVRARRAGDCGMPIVGNAVYERYASDATEKQNRTNVHVRGRSGRDVAHERNLLLVQPKYNKSKKSTDKEQFYADYMPMHVYYALRRAADVDEAARALELDSDAADEEMPYDDAAEAAVASVATPSSASASAVVVLPSASASASDGEWACARHGRDVVAIEVVPSNDRYFQIMEYAFGNMYPTAEDAWTARSALDWLCTEGCTQCLLGSHPTATSRTATTTAFFMAHDLMLMRAIFGAQGPVPEWSDVVFVAIEGANAHMEPDVLISGLSEISLFDVDKRPPETLFSTTEKPLFALLNGNSLCAVNSVVQALASLTFDIRSHLEPGEIHDAWTALISRHSDAARRHQALALSDEIAITLLGPHMTLGTYNSAHEVMDRVLGTMAITRRLIATNKRTCRNGNCQYSAVETTPLSSVVSLELERGGSVGDALAGRRSVEQVELDSRSKEKSSCCGQTQVQQGGWLLHDTLDIANSPVLVIQLERTTAKYLKTADNAQLGDWSLRAIIVATPGHFFCYGARRLEWPGHGGVLHHWYAFDCLAPTDFGSKQAQVQHVGCNIADVLAHMHELQQRSESEQVAPYPYMLIYEPNQS